MLGGSLEKGVNMSRPDKLLVEHVSIAIGTALKDAFNVKAKPVSEIAEIAIKAVDDYRNKDSDSGN